MTSRVSEAKAPFGKPQSDDGKNVAGARVKVMVVDDSAVVRGLIGRILKSDAQIEVVASVGNGEAAVATLKKNPEIDVIVLDIEMPVMDGLTALPLLLQVSPSVRVIVASTLSQRGAEISLRALEAGASDYLPKPSSAAAVASADDFRRELLQKVCELASSRARFASRTAARRTAFASPQPSSRQPTKTLGAAMEPPPRPSKSEARPATGTAREAGPSVSTSAPPLVGLRSSGRTPIKIIAIGTSTGGPAALLEVLSKLGTDKITQPVLVTQHMPKMFTAILADRIAKRTGLPCTEARDGEEVCPGHIYIAPGDNHLLVERRAGRNVIVLSQDPPENFCRPAVDPMLRSVTRSYGSGVLAVILTGMGSDGCRGCEAVVAAGGTVIAQDEATSVVWGMPGAVTNAGLCSAVLPLADLAPYIARRAGRVAS